MWLPKEKKYARKSLRTRSEATAIEKGKAAYLEIYANLQQGKSYLSILRAETSKVRKSRTFLCRNGQYFERLQEISKPKTADELIFTVDNANEPSKRTLLYHWHKMIELADIVDPEVRD
jgi:hypothetical protein